MPKNQSRLLFSLGPKDFEVQTFCTGGNGGQHRNAKRNGVRILHKASGARAEHRDGRDQGKNREEAFRKLVASKAFLAWHKMEVARLTGALAAAEAEADRQMQENNLRTEVRGPDGTWQPWEARKGEGSEGAREEEGLGPAGGGANKGEAGSLGEADPRGEGQAGAQGE